jgi:hypothetical protein
MGELFLIELMMCAAVIVVTAAVMVMHWRRGRNRPRGPVEARRGALAELADAGVFEREAAYVPGFSQDTTERGLGTSVPAHPEQAAESPVSGVADPEQAAESPVSGVADPEQAAESQVSGVADPELGSPGLGAEPDGPPAAAGAVTISERVGGYYEEADRLVADYLAASGWTEEPGKPGRVADADAAPASAEAAAEPGTARKQLAA